MYIQVTLAIFIAAMHNQYPHKPFSEGALKALYAYHEFDGEEMNVCDIFNNWTEELLEDIYEEYNINTLEELCENTIVLEVEGSDYIVYLDF